MLVFLKKNGQINLPDVVLEKMCLEEGDSLEIELKNEEIVLRISPLNSRKFYKFIESKVQSMFNTEDEYQISEITSPEEMLRKIVKVLEREEKEKKKK